MRINSIMPSIQAQRLSSTDRSNGIKKTSASSVPTNRQSGIVISFSGAEKNVNQFVSYAPENKRFKTKAYDQGGLGVVSYEAGESWRKHENLSDFRL